MLKTVKKFWNCISHFMVTPFKIYFICLVCPTGFDFTKLMALKHFVANRKSKYARRCPCDRKNLLTWLGIILCNKWYFDFSSASKFMRKFFHCAMTPGHSILLGPFRSSFRFGRDKSAAVKLPPLWHPRRQKTTDERRRIAVIIVIVIILAGGVVLAGSVYSEFPAKQ